MSANILYKPVTNEGKDLGVACSSRFLRIMGKCFADPPFILDKKDIPVISGMVAAWDDETDNPFRRLIEILENMDSIEVWAEY